MEDEQVFSPCCGCSCLDNGQWHLQVFSYLADQASLWLLFHILSTTFFSENWACLQNCKALFIQSSCFFPMLIQGMVSSLPLYCSSPMVQSKAWCNVLPAAVLPVLWVHPSLWVTFTYSNLDHYFVYFLLYLLVSEYRGKLSSLWTLLSAEIHRCRELRFTRTGVPVTCFGLEI